MFISPSFGSTAQYYMLTRDGDCSEPVWRDQILRRERGQGNIQFTPIDPGRDCRTRLARPNSQARTGTRASLFPHPLSVIFISGCVCFPKRVHLTTSSLHYTTLHYTTLHYSTLHSRLVHYSTLQHTTVHYTTVHYTTVHFSTPQYTTLESISRPRAGLATV